MGTVVPYRRLHHGPPRRLPAPRVRRRRRSPLAWTSRHFGLIAFGGVVVFLLAGGSGRQMTDGARTGTPSALAGYPTVIDGDTLRLDGVRIRIVGIDAPEMNQACDDASGRRWACGRVATQQLRTLISGDRVECTARGHDVYGRTLASCATGNAGDLGGAMVREGYAVNDSGYRLAEAQARLRGRGVWAGDFDPPRTWRRAHRR